MKKLFLAAALAAGAAAVRASPGAGLRIAEIGGLIRALECGDRGDVARARRMLTAAIENRQAALRSLAGMLSIACCAGAEAAP